MPPLSLHIVVAKRIREALGNGLLTTECGAYYLGSTAPDIRVITRWERSRTHFFDLHNFDEQDSVTGLFASYPDLGKPEKLNTATVAFVAGYITHLIMDETWINDIYRPYFGAHSPLKGDLRANLMDRAIQYELDRRRREDRQAMEHIVEELANTPLDIDVGFIDNETLQRWRQVAIDIASQPPDWERFRYIASRHLREAGIESADAYEEFARMLPSLLDETIAHVGAAQLEGFIEKAATRAYKTIAEYLGCE